MIFVLAGLLRLDVSSNPLLHKTAQLQLLDALQGGELRTLALDVGQPAQRHEFSVAGTSAVVDMSSLNMVAGDAALLCSWLVHCRLAGVDERTTCVRLDSNPRLIHDGTLRHDGWVGFVELLKQTHVARPAQDPFGASVCAARTLNAAGQPRVTLSLR